MADLLLRGRGADVGVRAPGWLVRLAGAALGLGVFSLAESLGAVSALGLPTWLGQLTMLCLGAAIAPTRAGSLLWILAGLLAAVACLVSFTPLVQWAAPSFVRADPDSGRPVDAVAVLSGGMTNDGLVSGPALDRLLTGLAEARSRDVPVLAISALEREVSGVRVTSETDQRALAALLAPGMDVRVVRNVHSTRDEALAFAALARTHRWTRVLLVTSPTHTRRACAAVEAAGLAVQCQPSKPRDYSIARLRGAAARRLAFADVLYESAATLLYDTRGWLP